MNFVFLLIKLYKVVLSFGAGHEIVKCEQGYSLSIKWGNRRFWWENQMIIAIPLGNLRKIWAVI